MSDMNHTEPSLDPRLKALLGLLRETPARDPEAESRGRARYLAEVDDLFGEPTRPMATGRNHRPSMGERPKGWLGLPFLQPGLHPRLRPRLAFTTLLVSLALVLLLFGGGVTTYAAQGALPGDALYSLKTRLEETQVRLSRDAARQAQLHLDFAERRLDEIASLIAQGRFDDIGTATFEFEAHVQQAIDALEIVSAGDPARANALAVHISSALTRYALVLKGMLAEVPETVKPVMEKAILTSEDESREVEFSGAIESVSPDGIQIGGKFVKIGAFTEIKGALVVGAVVKVHALQDPDGAWIASQIEVASSTGDVAGEGENANENEAGDGLDDNEDDGADDLNEDEDVGDLDDDEAGNDQDEHDDGDNANLNDNDVEDENDNQDLNDNDDDDDSNDNGGSNLDGDDDHGDDDHNDNDDDNQEDGGEHDNDNGGGNENQNNNDD